MIVVQFRPEHLHGLLLQPSQAIMQQTLADPAYGQSLAAAGPAYSAIHDDQVLACAGLIPQWPNRALAWALVASEAGRHMISIHKAVLKTLSAYPCRRIETAVSCNFSNGHRWATMLGFQKEGTMRAYTPDGSDCNLYARLN